jgi:nucleotide-binding universal stress UspA family protein
MTKIFKKIMCPVDFDQTSAAAVELACELAESHSGTVYLLNVVSPSTMEPILREPYPIITEAIARKELEKVARQHLESRVPHRFEVRTGNPAEMIVAAAEELGVDLIVMATHSGGITRLTFGSVAERVVHAAMRPVLTIRPHAYTARPKTL